MLCRLSGKKRGGGEKIDKIKNDGEEERKKRTQDSRKVKMVFSKCYGVFCKKNLFFYLVFKYRIVWYFYFK